MRGRAVKNAIAAVLGILVILALAFALASTAPGAGTAAAEIAAESHDDAEDEWIVVAVVEIARRAVPPRVAARTVPMRHRLPGPPPVPPPER